ncbi:MAG: chromosomal replication initiator DnaA [Pseudomonadota bacterium]
MSQLALPFEPIPGFGRADFMRGSNNAAALAAIDEWRAWPARRLALIGPPASGKSHLASIWAQSVGAARLDPAGLVAADPTALPAAPLLIEDGDRAIAGDPAREAGLFHLCNAFASAGQWMLLTGRIAPARWAVALPDLASRLTAMTPVQLAPPDDALLRGLLVKHFAERGVAASEPLLRFLLRRMERSAEAAAALARTLDMAALAEKTAISVPFARRILGW